jgi:hypothetical protein
MASLQETSSGPTGCDPSEISIGNEGVSFATHTWTASCGGRTYRCSGASRDTGFPFVFSVVGTACSPINDDLNTHVPVFAREVAAMEAESVPVVVGRDASRRKTFKSTFQSEPFGITLFGVPALNTNYIALYIDVPPAYEGKSCELGFFVDGEIVPPSSFRVKAESRKRVKVILHKDTIELFTKASFVSGRFCESEWRLSKAHAKIVSEFSTRFREEASWIASKATPVPVTSAVDD